MQFVNAPDSTVGNFPTQAPVMPNRESGNRPAIIGGSIGGVFGLGLIVLLILYLRKRRANKRMRGLPTPNMLFLPGVTRPSTDMSGPVAKGFDSPPNRHSIPDTSGPV
jgi:hypothetical protein